MIWGCRHPWGRAKEMFRFDAEVEVFLDIDEETDDEVLYLYFEVGEHGVEPGFNMDGVDQKLMS